MFKTIDIADINRLKATAKESPLKRSRICLHTSHIHLTQESVICATRSNYFRPHKHPPERSESYHIIEGRMLIVFFTNEGQWLKQIVLGPVGDKYPFYYRLNEPYFHWVQPLSDWLIYHETLTGPWNKTEVVDYADFAPREDDDAQIIESFKLHTKQLTKG